MTIHLAQFIMNVSLDYSPALSPRGSHRSESNAVIGLIVLGLAFVFFLVVAFFSSKTWHVGHVVAMSFLFLFTLVMLFLTATLFRTYEKFQQAYEKSATSLVQEQARHRTLMSGNPGEPAGEGSLKGEQLLARVEQFGRGRIWRNVYGQVAPGNPEIGLRMSNWANDGCMTVGKEDEIEEPIEPVVDDAIAEDDPGADAVDVVTDDEVPTDDPDAGDGAAPPDEAVPPPINPPAPAGGTNPHGIVEGQFLFAFKEYPISIMTPAEKEYYFSGLGDGDQNFADIDTRSRCRVPMVFLGRFRVVRQTDQLVVVLPDSRLDPFQMQQIGNQASWVLYENLPSDSHHLFHDVEPEQLSNLIPLKRFDLGTRISPANYQSMLKGYVEDGQEITQPINDPMRVSVEVKFKQAYEVAVDLDVEGELPQTNQPFNVEGRAQIRNLIQGEPTKFEPDDTAILDGATADRLVQQGIAERVGGPKYRRRLRDFEFELQDNEQRHTELNESVSLVTKKVSALQGSLDHLQAQTDKLKAEMAKLQEDLQGFNAERTAIGRYLQLLKDRVHFLQREITRLNAARASVD